jgi:hypothetical protein
MATDAGFRPGDDIIAVSYMPGLVFALGGRSPGHPTFLVWTEKFLRYSKQALQFSEVARCKKALLLVSKDATESWLKDLLNSGGLDFPAGYQRVGTVTGWGNEFTLYRPVECIAPPRRQGTPKHTPLTYAFVHYKLCFAR